MDIHANADDFIDDVIQLIPQKKKRTTSRRSETYALFYPNFYRSYFQSKKKKITLVEQIKASTRRSIKKDKTRV